MKASLLFIYIILLPFKSIGPLDQFKKVLPKGWSSTIKKNALSISKDSLVEIYHCNYGVESNPPISMHLYKITIKYTQRLSDREINIRQSHQDSILYALEQAYTSNPTKSNMAAYEIFYSNRHTIDSLAVPFLSDDQYSYFITDNFPQGHCFKSNTVETEILAVLAKLKN